MPTPHTNHPGHTHRAIAALHRLPCRPRLAIAAGVMLLAFFVLPVALPAQTRALLAWNAGAWLFIALIVWMMAHDAHGSIRAHAAAEDENRWVLLLVGVLAVIAALAAIVAELGNARQAEGLAKAAHLGLVAATILSAWTFIHLLFALHYAGEYFAPDAATDSADDTREGLGFPGGKEPGWSDFAYYSFVIACACATADVDTVSRAMRRTTLAHGIIAFLFNTVILALTINIGAGLT